MFLSRELRKRTHDKMGFGKDNIVLSSSPLVKIPGVSLTDLITSSMLENASKPCETEYLTGRQHTFKDVLDKSIKVASFLRRNDVQPLSSVGIHCGNILEYTSVAYGIVLAGCTIVSIRGETLREVRHQIDIAKPTFVFTESRHLDKVHQAAQDVANFKGVVTIGDPTRSLSLETILESQKDEDFRATEVDQATSTALITFTSGTTGLPKGAQLTYDNVKSFCYLYSNMLQASAGSPEQQYSFLTYSSPVHASGFCYRFSNLFNGQHMVLIPSSDIEIICKSIETHSVELMAFFPVKLLEFMKSPLVEKYNLSSLKRMIINGGSPSKNILALMKAKLNVEKIIHSFAMTEILVSFESVDKPESMGCPMPNMMAKVLNPSTGQVLGSNEQGELYVKGPTVMKGYLNDEKATKDVLDQEGWFRTGDIVYFDDEGHFYFVERAKDLLKCKDCQVSPSELEDVLVSHPAVEEAVVVGIPSEEYGEAPRAFVVRN